ncbi:(R)-stereoselective amidase [Microbulbifer aggregans]|uniref:(R)-stereoselective amidase n=1 Tax=Microbulbifer aggregans TaxID=1769779 RepID=A0A1C9WAZ0_9GAMM|nr:nitrilase-related carbon-nitrogen hydrolase [Microbulbifer aggregans]AOS98301.1 (R)-stereoselective amidase [Microbulbifer aggregans]
MNNKTIRVAAAQFHVGTDVEENLGTVLRMLDQAAEVRPDLVVLPEFCNHLSWYDSQEHCAEVSVTLDGAFLQAVAEKARALGIHVVVNCTVRRDDGTITGSSLMYSPEGQLIADNTKQIYIGHENDFLESAREPGPVVDTPLGRIGLYACMDGVINEPPRTLALRGAELLCNSLNSFAGDEGSLHVPVRAPENHVFIVAANKVGPLVPEALLVPVSEATGIPQKFLCGAGESQVVAPDGTVLACASTDREEVVYADIQPGLANDKRRGDGTDIFASRRPELYQPIAADPATQSYPQWCGAESVAATVVDPLTHGRDGLRAAVSLVREAVVAGAQLVAVPPLLSAEAIAADLPAALDFSGEIVESLRQCCAGDGVVTTALPMRCDDGQLRYCAVVVGETGVLFCQGQVHPSERFAWSIPAVGFESLELPFGRIAAITSDDSIYPETFRLLALAGVDTAVVPLEPQEAWELRTGLLERSAENRINLLAAAISSPLGQGFATALQRDFTVMTPWKERPFDGLLSQPELYRLVAGTQSLAVTIHPAAAGNKEVSRNTDLVASRPWKLCGAITSQ